jgi:TolC family type I secretion outer membrane protein
MRGWSCLTTVRGARTPLGLWLALWLGAAGALAGGADTTNQAQLPGWLAQPLSLSEAINLALKQNLTLQKARQDIEATHGIIIQTRAIALPKLRATGDYSATDALENLPLPPGLPTVSIQQEQSWSSGLRLVQSVYEGGRIQSAVRTTRLLKDQALFQYQAVAADTLLAVRTAYYDVLLGEQQIQVQRASTNLLARELEDTRRRFEAGTVPRFNVLRAEVELASALPQLSRAQNNYRIAKNNLANVLGCQIPPQVWEDVPLQLSGTLAAEPFEIQLPDALAQALARRPELGALRLTEKLSAENILRAKAGYKPSVQLFGGYGWRSSAFSSDLTRDVRGWNAGAQLNWDIFDGRLTQGRILEAQARAQQAKLDLEDARRRVELEVRTADSQFLEAREVLASQEKVLEHAEEALRLASSRAEAGTGTQLDVLSAQTALTAARTTRVQALRDYGVTRARLLRAIGEHFERPAR